MKKTVYIILAVVVFGLLTMFALRMYTKSHSPFETLLFKDVVEVEYCRPYKNERVIFGELVPYEKVWRTGANEATLVRIKKPLKFGGVEVGPGEYSLWTIPGVENWKVILNTETGQWGINNDGIANREPENDVLQIETPVIKSQKVFEQFTIQFTETPESVDMELMWDQTMVVIPLEIL